MNAVLCTDMNSYNFWAITILDLIDLVVWLVWVLRQLVLSEAVLGPITETRSTNGANQQGSTKSLAALTLLADKTKSHGQMLTKITYILSRLCMETVGKGIWHRQMVFLTAFLVHKGLNDVFQA